MFHFLTFLLLGLSKLVNSSIDSTSFLDDQLSTINPDEGESAQTSDLIMLTWILVQGSSPSDFYLNDEASPPLALNELAPKQDVSLDGNLFSNDGTVNAAQEDPLLNNSDESFSSNQFPDDAEVASTSCLSNFSPSGKSRKREDRCNSLDPLDPNLSWPTLGDIDDMLQKALQRKFCSQILLPIADFIPICAYSGQSADDNFWHVSGYLCELIATYDFCPDLLR